MTATTSKKSTATPKAKKAREAKTEKASVPSTDSVEVSPVSEWKKKNKLTPMTMPSGLVMKIRRVGFEAFMKAGIIPNSLMAIVQDGIDKGKDPDNVDIEIGDLMDDAKGMSDLFELIDEVAIFCVVEPRVHRVPTKRDEHGVEVVDEDQRDDEKLYVDEIDQEDKAFIFNLSQGGTDDVSQFRSEQANSVASVPGLSVVGSKAKQSVGSDG